jgi:putative transposase
MVGIPRSSYRYQSKPKDDAPVAEVLTALTEKHADIGFWQCFYRIRNKGYQWNHKKVYRIYTAMKLNIHRKPRKGYPQGLERHWVCPMCPTKFGVSIL